MLPSSHRQPYQELQHALEHLQQATAVTDIEPTAVQMQFQQVQQLFKSQIVTLSADELPVEYISRWQSLQTEIYKQMRLLQTDIMLLLSARSQSTLQARQASIDDRLTTLIQYCQGVMQL